MKFEVKIIYKGQSTFIVEAENEEAADEKAMARYEAGEDGDCLQNDYQTVETTITNNLTTGMD